MSGISIDKAVIADEGAASMTGNGPAQGSAGRPGARQAVRRTAAGARQIQGDLFDQVIDDPEPAIAHGTQAPVARCADSRAAPAHDAPQPCPPQASRPAMPAAPQPAAAETTVAQALGAALEAAHEQALAPQDCGTWLDNPRSAFARWKLSQRVRGKVEFDEHSIEQYTSMWGRFCAWMVERPSRGALRVDEVTAADIESYLLSLRGGRRGDRPVAPSTARRYLFLLHRTFEHLELLGVVDANPCADLPQLKGHQAGPRPARTLLLPAQEAAYIDWCMTQPVRRWDQCRNRALRLIFLASGITVSEARRLRATDVRIEALRDFEPPRADGDAADTGRDAGEETGDGDTGAWCAVDALQQACAQDDGASSSASSDEAKPPAAKPPRPARVALLEVEAHGNTPARTAPVAPFAIDAIEEWLRVRKANNAPGDLLFNTKHMLCSAEMGTDESVTPGEAALSGDSGAAESGAESGRPSNAALSAEEIYDLVCTALRECEFDGRRAGPATLRNTFMARQIRAGIALDRIRDWVGLRTIEPLRALQRQVPIRHDGLQPE